MEVVSKESFLIAFLGKVSASEVVEHYVLWGDAEVVEHRGDGFGHGSYFAMFLLMLRKWVGVMPISFLKAEWKACRFPKPHISPMASIL